MSGRAAGGGPVAALARLRRVESGLVEQLSAVRAAIDDLEGLKAAGEALPGSGLLTVEETAAVLRASRSRVFELLAAGELDGVRVGRARCVSWTSIERFLARLGAA